jgi:hypothetical protein
MKTEELFTVDANNATGPLTVTVQHFQRDPSKHISNMCRIWVEGTYELQPGKVYHAQVGISTPHVRPGELPVVASSYLGSGIKLANPLKPIDWGVRKGQLNWLSVPGECKDIRQDVYKAFYADLQVVSDLILRHPVVARLHTMMLAEDIDARLAVARAEVAKLEAIESDVLMANVLDRLSA